DCPRRRHRSACQLSASVGLNLVNPVDPADLTIDSERARLFNSAHVLLCPGSGCVWTMRWSLWYDRFAVARRFVRDRVVSWGSGSTGSLPRRAGEGIRSWFMPSSVDCCCKAPELLRRCSADGRVQMDRCGCDPTSPGKETGPTPRRMAPRECLYERL